MIKNRLALNYTTVLLLYFHRMMQRGLYRCFELFQILSSKNRAEILKPFFSIVLITSLLTLSACTQAPKEPQLLFNSEKKFRLTFDNELLDLEDQGKYGIFTEAPYAELSPVVGLYTNPLIRDFRIQFSGGNNTQRWARLVDEGVLAEQNRVLEFGLASAYPDIDSLQTKGRVQLNVSTPQGARALLVELKLKLGDGFKLLQSSDLNNRWLTIAEWWNDEVWSESPYGFSMAVNVVKPKDSNRLFFSAHGRSFSEQTAKFRFLWSETNRNFDVPIGEWLRVKYFLVEGKNGEGRFSMFAAKSGEPFQEVLAIRNSTVHPDNPLPDGLTAFNPLKLYTGQRLLNYLSAQQQSLSVFFDDVSISFE